MGVHGGRNGSPVHSCFSLLEDSIVSGFEKFSSSLWNLKFRCSLFISLFYFVSSFNIETSMQSKDHEKHSHAHLQTRKHIKVRRKIRIYRGCWVLILILILVDVFFCFTVLFVRSYSDAEKSIHRQMFNYSWGLTRALARLTPVVCIYACECVRVSRYMCPWVSL